MIIVIYGSKNSNIWRKSSQNFAPDNTGMHIGQNSNSPGWGTTFEFTLTSANLHSPPRWLIWVYFLNFTLASRRVTEFTLANENLHSPWRNGDAYVHPCCIKDIERHYQKCLYLEVCGTIKRIWQVSAITVTGVRERIMVLSLFHTTHMFWLWLPDILVHYCGNFI